VPAGGTVEVRARAREGPMRRPRASTEAPNRGLRGRGLEEVVRRLHVGAEAACGGPAPVFPSLRWEVL
jgi:hypothetical protein